MRPTEAPALSATELLAILDREIDEAHRQAHRPGWTPWALLTALAALLWAFVNRMDHITAVPVVFQSAVIALMAIELLRRGRQVLTPSSDIEDEGRVAVSSEELGVLRPAIVLELVYAIVLLWGIGRFADRVPSWSVAVAMAWAGFAAFLAVIGLLYSAWPVPFPVGVSVTSPLRLLIQGVPLLLPTMGVIGYATAIAARGAEDIRAGLLLGSAAAVLLELAREPDAPPLVGELVQLRRRVSFGDFEQAEAVQRTIVLLRGLKLEEYVQQDARRMLRALESLRSAITRFRPIVAEISRLADELRTGSAPDGQTWKDLLAQWEQEGELATKRFQRAAQWQRRYTRRLAFAEAMGKNWKLPYEGQALVAEIKPQVDGVTIEYKEMVDQYRVALERLKQALRTAGLIS